MNDEPTDSAPDPLAYPGPDGSGLAQDPVVLEAEVRARGAESRAAALEGEVASIRERSAMMDEQFEQLRVQLQALSGAVVGGSQLSDSGQDDYEEAMYGAHTPVWTDVGPAVGAPAWDGSEEAATPAWEERVISEPAAPPPVRDDPPAPEPDPIYKYEVRPAPEPASQFLLRTYFVRVSPPERRRCCKVSFERA